MRSTPCQGLIKKLCGHMPRNPRGLTKQQIIREGRRSLVRICRCDFGYDLLAWHEYLWKNDKYGYRRLWSESYTTLIQQTLADPEWQEDGCQVESGG
ncbi:hypothetical protein [Bremerella sp.]|uniref:hypothetical protein n=1 Tax=Bremerella sp. TaxID=2795602 RepID=UPI003918FF19